MSKANNELPKSKKHMDSEEFYRLYLLIQKQNWLEESYNGLIELWNLCDKNEQKELIEDLLKRFVVLNLEKIEKACKNIADHISNKWYLIGKSTKIVAMCSGDKPDGSQFILQCLKNKFADIKGWEERDFVNNLKSFGQVNYQIKSDQSVVLIDDFIGTGKTAIRKTEWLINKFKKKNLQMVKIYIISLACMEAAVKKIGDLKVDFYSPYILKKGINDFYCGNELEENIRNMENLESLLHPNYKQLKLSEFNFGYGRSETLFTIQGGNVPNNVFPIFWWPLLKNNSKRKTILRRII
jgi:hypoxanthine-guanine phosphoribosyltransferase